MPQDTPPQPVAAEQAFGRLAALRARLRILLVLHRFGWLVGGLVAAMVALAVVDYGVRLPAGVRVLTLLTGIGGVLVYGRRMIMPAARFNPSLEELALRVERTEAAGQSGLRNVLASGVGFAGGQDERMRPVVAAATERLEKLPLGRVVDSRRAVRGMAFGALALVALIGLMAVQPVLTFIGAERVLTPWSAAQWPKRADIRDATNVKVHPLGSALALRAALVKGGGNDPRTARVTVRYRLVGGGGREVGMTYQERDVVVPAAAGLETSDKRGALFEALVEPGALIADMAHPDQAGELEYSFISADDRTDPVRVKLVPPPAITGAKVTIEPPTYAADQDPRTLEAGPGIDERANITGVLPGSRVQVVLTFSKDLPVVTGDTSAWVKRALGPDAAALLENPDASVQIKPGSWTLAWAHRKTVRLAPHAVDENGVEPVAESVYRIELREDRPPEAVITDPPNDIEVLPAAKLAVVGEARDDVGVKWAAAKYRIATAPGNSTGAAPEVAGEGTELTHQDATPPTRTVKITTEIDLAPLKLAPGQEVWLNILAADAYLLDGKAHEPAASPVRKLRVISTDQFIEQMWNELAGVRRQAIRLTEQQEKLAGETAPPKNKDAAAVARQQNDITDGINRAGDAVNKVRQRLNDNKVAEPDLNATIGEARALLEQAKEASSKATDAARKSDESKRTGDKATEASQRKQAGEQQEETTKALEQAAEALDRGQDAWASTRAIQRLVQDQEAVKAATQKLGEQTVGKNPEDLPAAVKQQVDALAEQQDQLARRTEEAIRKMQERAAQMKQNDPTGASALEEAAKRGQQNGVTEQMQQAGKQIRKNQQQQANSQQSKAGQSLQQMLDSLKQSQQSRDATLKRQLASLGEAIDALIRQQTVALAALEAAGQDSDYSGLDQAMIRLHTGTLAAVGQAKEAGREARKAATLLGEAADAQQEAVTSLRASPADAPTAKTSEDKSLEKLKAAKDETEKQRQAAADRDAKRKREELKQAYQQLLSDQTSVRVDSQDLVGKEPDRRLRIKAGELADRQDAVATKSGELVKDAQELRESDLFSFAHQRLDDASGKASEILRSDAFPPTLTARQGTAERVLRQLIEALEESKQPDEPFREPAGAGQQGGGGQQQQQKLIPPIAELKLIKSMQEEALALTRQANEAGDKELAADAVKLQNLLAGRAEKVLEKLEQGGGGGGGGGPPATPPGGGN